MTDEYDERDDEGLANAAAAVVGEDDLDDQPFPPDPPRLCMRCGIATADLGFDYCTPCALAAAASSDQDAS